VLVNPDTLVAIRSFEDGAGKLIGAVTELRSGDGWHSAEVIAEGPEQSLVVRKVGITHRVICGSPTYLSKHGVPRSARELVKHRLVRFPRFTGFFDWSTLVPSEAVLRSGRGTIQLSDGESLTAAALAGAGLILVLDILVDEELRAGRLRTVLDELRPPPRPISVAYPVTRHLSPKVRAFVDFVVSLFEPSLKGKRPRRPHQK
jgi:DNA-binding transcriptional LysR family regulator